jgi:hypothetical protein
MGGVQAIQVQVKYKYYVSNYWGKACIGHISHNTHGISSSQRTDLAKNRNGNAFSISPVDIESLDITVRHG